MRKLKPSKPVDPADLDGCLKRAVLDSVLRFLVLVAVSLALILSLRGVMNLISRNEFISQRLEDYPRLYEHFLRETQEIEAWWHAADDEKQAELAAYLYRWDEIAKDEQEKLAYIAETVGAERILVTDSPGEAADALATLQEVGLDAASAPLADGRQIVLGLHGDMQIEDAMGIDVDAYFLSQLHAGLPGYVLVQSNDSLSVYPEGRDSDAIKDMVRQMLDSEKLDPAALSDKAKKEKKNTAFLSIRNPAGYGFPAGQYVLRCAAYADSSNFVVHIAETEELLRIGRTRSWSLWFLFLCIYVSLLFCLWQTDLFDESLSLKEGLRIARRRSSGMILLAGMVLAASVVLIQLLSGINQSAQSAEDEAAFLKRVLQMESTRADNITTTFDSMYWNRAETAAAVLSRNPQLADMDSLRDLDKALGGAGLRVFDTEGKLIASDDLFRGSEDDPDSISSAALWNPNGLAAATTVSADGGKAKRTYRAALTGGDHRTTGYLELTAPNVLLDSLLADTQINEVIGDMHMLSTLHAVAVDSVEKDTIVASSYANWAGESAKSFGIPAALLYDGYEGMVNFDGNSLYSVVFVDRNILMIVSCEDLPLPLFLASVAVLVLVLVLLAGVFLYVGIGQLYSLQGVYEKAGKKLPTVQHRHPPIRSFLHGIMLSLFFLSAILYLQTDGNPGSITYSIVRGEWVRGISAMTITTCVMLVSLITAIYTLLDLALAWISKYLSPKGKTVCGLIGSVIHYMGAIVVILYALSMFGVNTATLIGGVGATALIFTLGANSLIADVIAGIFLIFEGDYTVGDIVTVGDFRGLVTEVTMRTTKLQNLVTNDIKIISNSTIKEFINQSRKPSRVLIDIRIDSSVGLAHGEEILREKLEKLPERYPEIIGTPEYLGVVTFPERNYIANVLTNFTVRIAFDCREKDRERLTYQIYQELLEVSNILLEDKTTAD